MKPPEDVTRKVLAEWLRKADTDLAVADQLLSQEVLFPIAVSFHAQQSAEKYLKAFLTGHQVASQKHTTWRNCWTSLQQLMITLPRLYVT